MNKKKLIYGMVIPLFAMLFVTAGLIQYYDIFEQTLTITQPITVVGDLSSSVPCSAGEICGGESFTITNAAPTERTVLVDNDANGSEIEVSYVGELELTKKNPVDWTPTEDKATITYTAIGNNFKVSGVPEGYTLIYYMDNEDNADVDARLITLGEAGSVTENLPHSIDWNAGDLANYCDNINGFDDYDACRGAKLWAVPNGNIVDESLIWSNPENFYFETDLIQFNKEGELIIYPGQTLTLTPSYTTNSGLETGNYNITTTVSPTA